MKKDCKGVDFITQKKLLKGYQLHHKDMRSENYAQLIPERFVCCNRKTHELIHFCFNYYKDDKDFIQRLQIILDEMCRFNND